MNFFFLMFAHFIGDFALQSEYIAKLKGKEPLFLFAHVFMWTGCILIAMNLLGIPITLFKFLFLFIGHYIVDYLKCKIVEPIFERLQNLQDYSFGNDLEITQSQNKIRFYLYVDQLFHLFQLIIIYLV